MEINPYSAEVRYTLDLMAYYLHAAQPCSVRIASSSSEVTKAVVRRLCCEPIALLVESPEIQAEVRSSLGVETDVFLGSDPADAALFPFSLEEGAQPAGESTIVAACRNALSYKSLLYPGTVRETVFREMAKLKPMYHLKPVVGLYPPRFVLRWTLAKIVERINSAWYFRLEDGAMRKLVEFGPMWRFCYIVVFVGRAAR